MFNQGQLEKLGKIFCPIFSDSEIDQAINARVNQQTEAMRRADDSIVLGSEWAKITAQMAADRLGWRLSDVIRELSKDGNNLAKTEQNNAAIILKTGLKEKLKSKGIVIAWEEKVKLLIKSWEKKAISLGCNEDQSKRVAQCFGELQLTQTQTGLIENSSKLIELLTLGAKGNPVDIVELHCIPTLNTNSGTEVVTKTMIQLKTADGSTVTVDQESELNEISKITKIFEKFEIAHNLSIILIDIDAFFVDGIGVDENIEIFEENLKSVLKDKRAKVERVSRFFGINKVSDFLNLKETKEIMANFGGIGESSFEKLVNEIFEKLNKRNLPKQMQTRQAAREFAKRRLAIELMLGKHLSTESSIFIQRATTKNSADLFLSGAKQTRKQPLFLFFWVDRWI